MSFSLRRLPVGMLAQFTITKAIHNLDDDVLIVIAVGMLAQFTITKAIHNSSNCISRFASGWNVSSIYNYESHSQHDVRGFYNHDGWNVSSIYNYESHSQPQDKMLNVASGWNVSSIYNF